MKQQALFYSKDGIKKRQKKMCRLLQFLFCALRVNSLTTEKQTTKFSSANFQKMLSPSYIILRIQRLEGKQCRSRRGGSL